ncbi:hypothetical protein PsorP6_005079 [Peronosclerospora sorghi]|uniref:Uncharacterized protein n=1 Tax=Peronosclerospora sorghi TaxID=230839 RepID=A0ACC0W483_9STRA|nr:hypothetical protein PsorP6_005079 [Peronosclerospora sorghi]
MLTIVSPKRQKESKKKRRKIHDNQRHIEAADEKFEEGTVHEDELQEDEKVNDVEAIAKTDALSALPEPHCGSKAVAKHEEIRCKDGRQKTKVLLLVDARSIFKLMRKKLNIRQEMVKPKSRFGVGSARKPEMVYKNIGLVKTPLERYKDVNKSALLGYKSGKLSTLLAEDVTFYPYMDLNVQHVIIVARETSSALNLDRNLLQNVALHSFIIADKSTPGVSEPELNSLKKAYEVTFG